MAIAFLTPPYHNEHICRAAKVKIQLLRRSDGATSEPHNFEYIPIFLIGLQRIFLAFKLIVFFTKYISNFTDVPDFNLMHQKRDDETLLSDILQLQDSCNLENLILPIYIDSDFNSLKFTDISEKYSAHEEAHLSQANDILNLPSFDSE